MTNDPYAGLRDELPDDILSQLTRLAEQQDAHEDNVARLERELKEAKAQLRDVQERAIPELMDSLGVTLYELKNGVRVEVKETLRFSVPKDKKDEAYNWLEQNDAGGAIKRHVGADFPVDEAQEAENAAALLRERGIHVDVDRRMAPATMGAILREMLEAGENVPLDLFGAYRQRKSKITRR